NTKVVLSQEVLATKIMQNGKMQFRTEELTAFPKTREIETDKTVIVESPQAEFVSKGLKANLNDGQYEFFNVRGKYELNSQTLNDAHFPEAYDACHCGWTRFTRCFCTPI